VVIRSGRIGPGGDQLAFDQTAETIHALWPDFK